MMITATATRKTRVLIVGALALLMSQGAWSDEGQNSERISVVKVSIPDQEIAVSKPRIEASADAHIEALNETIARERARHAEAIHATRFELVLAELTDRG